LALVTRLIGWKRISTSVGTLSHKSGHEIWKLHLEREAYKQDFIKRWQKLNLDFLVSPGHSMSGVSHGAVKDLLPCASYTFHYNLLDFPAGVLAITVVSHQDILNQPKRKGDLWDFLMNQNERDNEGLPVGVQIAALPFREDVCIEAMQIVEELMPFTHKPNI